MGWKQLLVFFIAWQLSISFSNGDKQSDCKNRWIHIRRLPSIFNLDLLANCSAYPIAGDFCPYMANHGLGPKTHNGSRSWYRTDPIALELLFHRRMLEYPCLAADPSSADAVFLPYYGGLDALRYLYGADVNSSADHGIDLFAFLQEDNPNLWRRRGGHDHFLVMARPAWDLSQEVDADPTLWGTSFLETPEFFNITALTVESRPWPWQEQAVPYLTSFHPPSLALLRSWTDRVRRARRNTTALFVGGGGATSNPAPNIRRSIRAECDNASSLCGIVDCSNGVCEHDPIRFIKPMLQASFCLQPPGDTPTRRATFDSVIAGCIPVFFEDQSARSQYGWHFPVEELDEFSVSIPKEDVVFNGLRILDVLQAIPRSRVRRMREKLLEMIPRVVYRRHGSSEGLRTTVKDAFDIAIEGTLSRIRSRLQQVGFQ